MATGSGDDIIDGDGRAKVMQWLQANSTEILFSSSVDSGSPPPLIVISDDDQGENSASSASHYSISSSADMEATVSGLDRLRDRSEAMTNENIFYKALEAASVRYASDEVERIMNLNDDKDRYVPSTSMVMHVLRWLSIEVIATCGTMKWRNRVTELVRKSMYETYDNNDMQGDAE